MTERDATSAPEPQRIGTGIEKTCYIRVDSWGKIMSQSEIDDYLMSSNLMTRGEICQTTALEEFDLEVQHVRGLIYTEVENPHGSYLSPQKMYRTRDVVAKALEINGPTGQNPALRKEREDAELSRAAIKRSIREKQAAEAERLNAVTPAEKKCKSLGLTPDSKLPKKDALAKFGLQSYELEGLVSPCAVKANPINPRFAPMKLYKAGDIAEALVARGNTSVW